MAGQLAARDDAEQAQARAQPATVTHVIEHILPPEIACVAKRSDDVSTWLYPDEAAQIHGAVETRRQEFTTGRACARLALAKLGLPTASILRGAWREPIWPRGIVGSITHCKGYRAVAVAKQSDILTVGIDAEPDEQLPPGTLEHVAVAQEQAWLATACPGIHWDRLVFSAKESAFKAWFPLARDWLGFEQAIVSFQPTDSTFQVRLLVPLPTPSGGSLEHLTGRFMVRDGLLLTAIVVAQPERSASTVR